LDWQRHYRHLTHLAEDEPGGHLPDIAPGVQIDGDDIGRWLQRQRRDWRLLTTEQQDRLSKLGVQPLEAPSPAPAATRTAKGPSKAQQAFQRGLVALAQYVAREGGASVKRSHREVIVIDDQEHDLALGIWYSNQKQRRDKLSAEQLAALAELGVSWA
jgi:hypothetical protein